MGESPIRISGCPGATYSTISPIRFFRQLRASSACGYLESQSDPESAYGQEEILSMAPLFPRETLPHRCKFEAAFSECESVAAVMSWCPCGTIPDKLPSSEKDNEVSRRRKGSAYVPPRGI